MELLARVVATLDRGMRWVGFGLIALGVVAIVAPLLSGLAIAVVVGLVLLAAGALLGVFGVHARASGKGNVALIIGGLAALSGLVLVVQPSAGLAVVRWVLIAYLLASGVPEAALAFRVRPEDGWTAALGSAAVSLAAALVLWLDWPISGARAIGLMVGSKLVSSGVTVVRLQRTLARGQERLRSTRDALERRLRDRSPE